MLFSMCNNCSLKTSKGKQGNVPYFKKKKKARSLFLQEPQIEL